jgi:glycosyltransferase involved in cell wall biosynthesis
VNILFLTYALDHCCGVTRHIATLGEGLRERGHATIVIAPGGTMVGELRAAGWQIVTAPIGPDNKQPIAAARAIVRTVREHHIDIIHSHQRWPELVASVVGRVLRVPTAMTCHSLVEGRRALSYRSQHVFAVSAAAQQLLTGYFRIPDARVQLVPNAPRDLVARTPAEVAAYRDRLGIPAGVSVVASAGRFHDDKGFDLLVEAARILGAQRLPIRFVMAGDGEARDKLIAAARELPIVFPGEVEDMSLLYSLADVIAVPSRRESSGLVAMEAGLLAKPVVATDIAGLRELFASGTRGLVVPANDPPALAAAIQRLHGDAALRAELGAALRAHVAAHYSRAAQIDAVEATYRALVAHRRA